MRKVRMKSMRIVEGMHEESEQYTSQMKRQVEEIYEVVRYELQLSNRIEEIMKESKRIEGLFISEKEVALQKEQVSNYEVRLEEIAVSSLFHIERFRTGAWKKLYHIEEDSSVDNET